MLINFFKKSKRTFIAMGIIAAIAIAVFYTLLKPVPTLPIFNPIDVNPKLVDSKVQHVRKNHKIGQFSLIDQHGKIVTSDTFKHKIYIADFFFTRCPSICPVMTKNMHALQVYFKDRSDIMFLSHSVTPVLDSVPVLSNYAKRHQVNYEKWRLVTGDKKQIYKLARQHYFAALSEGDGGTQDFIHTEQFVLVDRQKRIRGFYDGTDDKAMKRLKKDVQLLLRD